jgi:hypothetical protein
MNQCSQSRIIFIGVFSALIVALPFLNKPFHIDDSVVLTVSKQIIEDPSQPFGGIINWVGPPKSIFKATTNPPFLSYYLTLFIVFFGCSEMILHLGMMLFLILLAVALALLSQRFARSSPWPLLFIMFSPAVVVSSNVMRDIPATALASMAVALFVMGVDRDRRSLILLGSVLAGLAILTKYSSAVLLPVMAVYSILSGRGRTLLWLAIPLLIFALWCLQNQLAHGQIHLAYLMQKQSLGFSWQSKFYGAIAILGSSLFIIPALIIDAIFKRKIVLFSCVILIAVLILISVEIHYEGKGGLQLYIWSGMGAMLLVWIFAAGFQSILKLVPLRSEYEERDILFLVVWFAAPFLFSIIFVPFQAVRHLIPALVPLAFLLTRQLSQPNRNQSRLLVSALSFTLLVQVTVAFLVNAADYEYSNTYRRFAKEISANLPLHEHDVWFTGNWGWQFYSNSAGFRHLSPDGHLPNIGDFIIEPLYVHKDISVKNVIKHVTIVDEKIYTASIPIKTMSPLVSAGFYSTTRNKLPYIFTSEGYLEIFRVYRVEGK